MQLRGWFLVSVILFLCAKIFAEPAILPEPLTLTTAQVLKLKKLFPASVQVEGAETSQPPMHLIWRQIPLNLSLPLNKERILMFPDQVELGIDRAALPETVLHVENNNGSVYLIAKAPFAPERVAVKLINQSAIILLNLSASVAGDSAPVVINLAKDSATQDNNSFVTSTPTLQTPSISYVDLTRFAVQQLYAPKRLLTHPLDIYRTPMHARETEPLILDGSVIAEPLASWRGGIYFVTAVLLRNQMNYSLHLKPTNLCGSWVAAAFFRNPRNPKDNSQWLMKAGTLFDSTTVFLTSTVPFENALQLCK